MIAKAAMFGCIATIALYPKALIVVAVLALVGAIINTRKA
jgi:hypothetical protein